MESENIDVAFFQDLETKLHKKEVRNSPKLVSELLADDFIEFGSSGLVYDKSTTLNSLGKEEVDLEITVDNFRVQKLSEGVVLVNYKTSKLNPKIDSNFESLRTSIWKFLDGKWQLIFHQGTRIEA
ncbi:DUF4440 domain-containing protein [Candidatus Nomurabacteria bacterium]|nr:DUF4440 domain-containing protein [Candidatus Nomurabacteria bacterium]